MLTGHGIIQLHSPSSQQNDVRVCHLKTSYTETKGHDILIIIDIRYRIDCQIIFLT